MRAGIEAAFTGPIVDLYSTSETGPIAVEGPSRRSSTRQLSICEENVFMEEPARRTGRAQPVQVIVTPYYSFGTPLIRYAPGDYASSAMASARRRPRCAGWRASSDAAATCSGGATARGTSPTSPRSA